MQKPFQNMPGNQGEKGGQNGAAQKEEKGSAFQLGQKQGKGRRLHSIDGAEGKGEISFIDQLPLKNGGSGCFQQPSGQGIDEKQAEKLSKC